MNNLDIKFFNKKHDYLICIDSDGTAIDAMNAKHKLCFGPAFIETWHLEDKATYVQDLWNQFNLYNETRGLNRFIGLVDILDKLNGKELNITDLDVLKSWVKNTNDLSNKGLIAEIEKTNHPLLKQALTWSYHTNDKIAKLSHQDKPVFEGVKSFLEFALGKVDIALISSANMSGIYEEWTNHHLIQYLDVMTAQEIGTKGECISQMIQKGYDPKHVLMIGDAYPDVDAAKQNNVYFYPIITNHETNSWQQLKSHVFEQFLKGNYDDVQAKVLDQFKQSFRNKEGL